MWRDSQRNTVFISIQLLLVYIFLFEWRNKEEEEEVVRWMLSAQTLKWTIVVSTHDENPIALCNLPYGLRIMSMLKRRLWVFDAQRGV